MLEVGIPNWGSHSIDGMTTLAARLKEAMEETGIKQVDIARACGVRPPSVNDWLNGRTKNLRGSNLVNTAALLGVADAWLADGKLPKYRTQDPAWPFPRIPRQRYDQLTPSQKSGIEDWVLRQLDAYLGAEPAKSEDTTKAA